MEPVASQTYRGQITSDPEAPERPALAPNVQLIGEMEGTGFRDKQWLVQRGDRFIQVTELLYRVAEQTDGQRTLEEIAEEVTEATEWMVTADNVRRLVQTKLIPLGLIATGDDAVANRDADRFRSSLQVNLRMKVLGPRAIDPATRLLRFFYTPPVLIAALLLIALAHWWLYFSHGVLESIVQVLYTPGMLLVVLAVMLAAGVFHEFGHASALRYGGGKVRGMGLGIYIIYPAFYTDVTDSYRLGRWARVRTDLGGFYFYLLFTLGIASLYFATGQEWLLFVILLIDLDIVRQTLPFVRLDGYWAFADLTGIPDLFSQMRPFLKSVLPARHWEGDRLPTLKTWVKVSFALYIVLTVPVLALLLFLLVTRAPRFLAVLWDSLSTQLRGIETAWSGGDLLGLAAAVSQALLVGIEILGITFLLFKLTWGVVRGLWNWSKPTPTRRMSGALVAAVGIALLAWSWVPQVSSLGRTPPLGTETLFVAGRAHVERPVSYTHTPPAGGDHAPIWQNCGFYSTPIFNENGVHSMEHGAVWITYRPDLPAEQLQFLRELSRQSHVLVSPYDGLPSPVVASAWGHQLRLDSADDPRLDQFVRAFRLGPQAPERGGPCTGGVGQPE